MRSLTPDQSQELEFGEILNSNKKIFISTDMDDSDLIRILFSGDGKNYLFVKEELKTKLLVSEAKKRLNLIEKLEKEPVPTNATFFRYIMIGLIAVIAINLFGNVGYLVILMSFLYGMYQINKKRQIVKTKENCEEVVKNLSVNEVDENPWTS